MNKKTIIPITVLLVLLSCSTGKGRFSLSLEFPDHPYDTLYLSELTPDDIVPLDTLVLDGKGFAGQSYGIEYPNFYLLSDGLEQYLPLILLPGEKIVISGSMLDMENQAVIRGSMDSELLLMLNRSLTARLRVVDSLVNSYSGRSTEEPDILMLQKLDSIVRQLASEQRKYNIQFIEDNPGSLASIVALFQSFTSQTPVLDILEDREYFMLVDSVLHSKYPASAPVQSLHAEILGLKEYLKRQELIEATTGIGRIPPDIHLPDPEGDSIRLSSTRGKIVLLDFWAAWCQPCRDENPNLVDNYLKYNKLGFEIYQVSLDRDREAWLKGIQDDRLDPWIHVSDLKYFNSEAADLYFIESIPANFLLDHDGTILAKNLRGEALGNKLQEIFENR